MKRNGFLSLINRNGQVIGIALGDTSAIADALAHAGKIDPKLSTAISMAAVELDNYSEALKTGDALRKMINDDSTKKR